ncbi:MAG: hypothetical protein IIT64_11340 [Bacteroidaceae bacterium]|nr:hypothetical protein [Bacteroidaceae bacterium]
MANEKSRWDILNERGSKERDKYKEEQDKKKKAAEEERKKKEETQKAKDKDRKARQDEYNKAPKRAEQMTYEEFARRLQSGEKYDDLAREYNAFETDRRLATPGGAGQYASFDQLPFEDQFAIMMAVKGGSPSNNKYLSSAMQTYKMLEGEARRIAKEYGVTPDDPDYQDIINTYIEGMYNDNYVSLDDVRNAATNMQNKNDLAYETSQQKADEAKTEQSKNQYYIDPVTGAPIENYNYGNGNSPKPFKERFNDFFNSSDFNQNMQTGWSPNNPMPSVPNSGDPTLPYMNYGTESSGYKPFG